MHDHRRSPVRVATALLLLLTLLLAACGRGAGGPATPAAPAASTPAASPSSSAPPVASEPPPSDGLPVDGAKVVVPKPGQLDPHPRPADKLAATVDGRKVVVSVDWWSGVEPCTVLDSIVVAKGDHAFTITLREGHGPEGVACIDLAELHRAFIDLGELEPGTYTISDALGGAAPIEVVVA